MLRVLKVILFLLIVLNLVFMFLFINAPDGSDEEFDVAQIEVTADLKHVFSNSKSTKGLLAINKESDSNRKSDELQKQIDLATQQSQMNQLQSEINSSGLEESILSSDINTSNFTSTPTSIEFDSIRTPKEAMAEKAKFLRVANEKASNRKKSLFSKIDKDKKLTKVGEAQSDKTTLIQVAKVQAAKEKLEREQQLADKKAYDLAKKRAKEKIQKAQELARLKIVEELDREAEQAIAKKAAADKLEKEQKLAKEKALKKQKLAQAQKLKEAQDLARVKAAEKLANQVRQAKIKAQQDLEAIQAAKLKVAEEKRKLTRAVAKKEADNKLKLVKEKKRLVQEQAIKEAEILKESQEIARAQAVKDLVRQQDLAKIKPSKSVVKKETIKVEHVIYNPQNMNLDGEVTLQWINRSVLKIRYPKNWLSLQTGDELAQDHIELWMDVTGVKPPPSYGNISYQIGIGLSKDPWIRNFLKTKKEIELEVTALSYGHTNEVLISNIPRNLRAYNVVFSKSSKQGNKKQAVLLSASETFKWGDEKTLLLKH